MDSIKQLSDPYYTAKFQRICGIEVVTKGENTETRKSESPGNQDRKCQNNNFLQDGFNSSHVVDRSKKQYHTNGGSEQIEQYQAGSTKSQLQPCSTPDYKINRKFLFYLFSLASSLGNEAFYLVFYPFCTWNVDSLMIRRTAIVWCLCMYLGQATKDYLLWSRPASPPVIRLESEFLQESSMPSTHAMSATAIPFMLAYVIISRYEIPAMIVLPIAITWCLLVCLSRLYLGVHSVLDICCGVVYSLLVMMITLPFLTELDTYQQTDPFAQIVIFVTSLAMCTICYPESKEGYSAKGDAVQIVAVLAGVSLGAWLNYQYGFTSAHPSEELYPIVFPSPYHIAVSIVRFFVGAVILAVIQLLLKDPCVKFFSYIFGFKTPNKKNLSVQTGYKFVVYYALGVSISFLVPFLHCMFGLDRPSYFTEVL